MKDFQTFNPTKFKTYNKRKTCKGEWELECDDILTFDIEVSSGWIQNGKVIGYHAGESDSYWNNLQPVSLCYIWQFSFNEDVYYGRNLKDIIDIFNKLPSNIHFIIYVHNLAYEFQFLNNYLRPWKTVFARNAHKVIYAISERFPNIEFRCSYFLTRLSLDSWGKTLNFPKLHSLDYLQLRTPKTTITQEEMDYAERDCRVVYKGIKKYTERYKHVDRIPLTQTGEVRRELKHIVQKERSIYKLMINLIPENAYMYSLMKRTFQGGYTHANFTLAGRVLKNGCAYDFASSYPAVACSEKFAITPFTPDIYEPDKIDKYAYLMKVKFDDVEAKTFNHYLSYSKGIDVKDVELDNGRVISAKTLTMWITEQDLDIILKTYKCKYTILECYRSRKAYLPTCIVKYILELYCNKTRYKDVDGMDDIYAQSKQFINSVFGMSVTDLMQDDIEFDGLNWTTKFKTTADVESYLAELKTDNKGRTFLAYQFGCWITAYARHNLWECLLTCDEDVVYCDTDSLKIRKDMNFDWYNEKIDEKMRKACAAHKIDFQKTRPKDPNGVEHPLGRFEREADWLEFKTLGAKRYCYRSAKDGKLHLTVSGINKEAVICLNDDIENFNEDTVFDKDKKQPKLDKNGNPEVDETGAIIYEGVEKKYSVYISNQPHVLWNEGEYDEYESDCVFGINMRPTGYSMSITDEYLMLMMLDDTNYLKCIY